MQKMAMIGKTSYNEWLILTKLLAVYHYISWGYCKLWWSIAAFEKKLSKSRKNFHNQEKLLESRKKKLKSRKIFQSQEKRKLWNLKKDYGIDRNISESTKMFQKLEKVCYKNWEKIFRIGYFFTTFLYSLIVLVRFVTVKSCFHKMWLSNWKWI